ncbi:transmembrane O-methyltransferase homolog isoform 1-T3 [Clarias gariepinus]|uniref:transmembrane O-methyltransferase homolog n=1 Tax=Clarias gariepinus TaxID=13013 RepID=UPI00234CD83C|nr:transmembrane O-methyltransferase homolog [Clarias gariepinus]XP_053361477.1 transmembrane O-methyltransferase homolog [Clarias gariepinus]XP_053361480.1 transmembrane O-methyltransferase homolog [Clarias gariepinus]XP_053361481.1 transmembrane O-methyltransferase homolog [Clarias gariepinus]XP_053361482.1 transmembrane O-methyltransferase homolog [Clarias gariepinus]XP_053361483.1 transmembrane O-methyltransferase homolog [Clarias gariepinus]
MVSLLLLSLPLLPLVITLCHSPLRALYRCVCERVLKVLPGRVCVRHIHAYIFSECTHGQAESVLATFDLYIKTQASFSIGPEKGVFLDEVVRCKAPLRVLELGMHCGYTSVRILRLLPTSGKLLTVEVDPLTAEKGEEILLVAGFKNSQFQVLPCSSAEAISSLASYLGEDRLDLVVMDHEPEQYLQDFLALQRQNLLSKHSFLVLNRVMESGAQVLLEYLTSTPQKYTVCKQVKDMLEIHCHTD